MVNSLIKIIVFLISPFLVATAAFANCTGNILNASTHPVTLSMQTTKGNFSTNDLQGGATCHGNTNENNRLTCQIPKGGSINYEMSHDDNEMRGSLVITVNKQTKTQHFGTHSTNCPAGDGLLPLPFCVDNVCLKLLPGAVNYVFLNSN